MGWLSNLFKKKKDIVEIKYDSLENWFAEKSVDFIRKKNERIDQLIRDFEQKKSEIMYSIQVLQNSELQNPNIAPKAKSYMTGNRESYIKQVELLIDSLPKYGPEFQKEFNIVMDAFAKKSNRNLAITAEFFKDEVMTVAKKISELSKIAEQIVFGKESQDFIIVENVKSSINELKNKWESKVKLENEIKNTNEKIGKVQENISKINLEIEKRENSGDYKELIAMKEEVIKLQNDLKYLEYFVNDMLAPIKKEMKKYAKISSAYEKLLLRYCEDTIGAWLGDEKLKIVNALQDMKKADIGLSIKDEKKVFEKIDGITRELLHSKKEEYFKLRKEIEFLNVKTKEMYMISEIAGLRELLKSSQDALGKDNSDLANLNERLLDINISEMLPDIQQKIESLVGSTIRIVMP